ncbi:MAG: hypothetical protein QXU69_07490 [Thermofilaceae archaeon]
MAAEVVVLRVDKLEASGVWTYSVSVLPRELVVSGVGRLEWVEVSGLVSASRWLGDVWANFILRRVEDGSPVGPEDGVAAVLSSGFLSSFPETGMRRRVVVGADVNGALAVKRSAGAAVTGLYATALLGSVAVRSAELRLAYTPIAAAPGAPGAPGAAGVGLGLLVVAVPLGLAAGAALARGRR